MASAKMEQEIFSQFTTLHPDFAGRPVSSMPGPNPPDFICVDTLGDRIGVELSEWLHEKQTARHKPLLQHEAALRGAIDSNSMEPPTKIGSVQLFANRTIRLNSADLSPFRDQLYSFIAAVDHRWTTLRDHDDPQGVGIGAADFANVPLVAKYIASMICTSRRYQPTIVGNTWITFFPHGGAFRAETALTALEATLRRKTSKYATLRSDARLGELYLLLYYDQAWLYNTPFDSPSFGFPEVVAHLSTLAAYDPGAFDKIFLFGPAKKLLAQVY